MRNLGNYWKIVLVRGREKGSALLVSLMVMVGLSLLGLGFVAVSETESAISVNERNYSQTLAVAEAGTRIAVEWFQAPVWANAQGLAPNNDAAIKRTRTVAVGAGTYTGVYKPVLTFPNLFDRPYRQSTSDRFYGTEASADIFIRYADGGYARTFLDALNARLFSTAEGVRITEILVFAPPIIGGTVNGGGFVENGTRYGLATIKVTAQKTRPSNDPAGAVIAQRSVKMVVSEWPFPGPQGPIQSNANISTGGNFGVHWGKMTSQGTMDIKRPMVGLPWTDAYQTLHFEHAYDETTAAGVTTNSYPDSLAFTDDRKWIYELLGDNLEDPWYEARARGRIVNVGGVLATIPHPYKYDVGGYDMTTTPDAGWCNWLQLQSFSDGGDRREVIFPKIDYDFWKEIAVQGSNSGQEGVYYLRPTGDEDYTNGIQTQNFAQWVNTARATNPARPGFYFFDTKDGLSPQGPGTPTNLADPITVNSSDDGNILQMQGFIYLNTQVFGTKGIGGRTDWYGYPGEPYRDVGYRLVDQVTGLFVGAGLTNGGNGEWDFQDLAFGANPNNLRFDVVVAARAFAVQPSGGAPASNLVPVQYTPGCNPGVNCSEPHEPYLNLIYPANAKSGGGATPVTIGWQADPGARNPKARKADASLPNCGLAADQKLCTSNGYDRDGRFVNDLDPILSGVFYNEGDYDSMGNAVYFGSLLINGSVIGTGTPEVWFDERLIKGMWPPPEMPIPRVYISAHQTDQ